MKILLADDDHLLIGMLRYVFQREGFNVLAARDGAAALQMFQVESPDLMVLDTQMPNQTGIEVLRQVRRQSKVPIMMLTVLSDEESVVRALELGADDYVTKPFRLAELRARVRALLRRRHNFDDHEFTANTPLVCGEIRLDPAAHQVHIGSEPVRLTPTEFSLLHYLMLNMDMVVSTGKILETVWGYSADESDEVVRVSVSRLRKKIEPEPSHPKYIVNVQGIGYKFCCETDAPN